MNSDYETPEPPSPSMLRAINAYTATSGQEPSNEELVIIEAVVEAGNPAYDPNTPIEEFIEHYEASGADSQDIAWAQQAAKRYVETMPDSQVRYLLHVLANAPLVADTSDLGWITWSGGPSPVAADILVDVKLRNKGTFRKVRAAELDWEYGKTEIFSYRISPHFKAPQ